MVSAKVLILASLAGCILALTPPKGLSAGSYRAYIDDLGREVHELVALPNSEELSPDTVTKFVTDENALEKLIARTENVTSDRQALSKRYYNANDYGFGVGLLDIWCGCGFNLDHGECDDAVQDLKNQVGSYAEIPFNMAWYSIRGNTVAFACTRPQGQSIQDYGRPSELNSDYLTISYAAITDFCGWYVAGTSLYTDLWEEGYNRPFVGYMQYHDGEDFCEDSTLSSVDHC
ncbi:hypothetical protein TMatcc_009506 [Talaromyces marneffei ATCC 18224]|uniref:Uncharacterized protein n=2 Tax=Talaromyces marneffei TaxID=37727 RepID=B6QSM0_TALMQ|nr:uncharacterized protein EYB26_008759 [Talaromyces marneffei]EEA19373.1 hypothetical protein PMAA_001680 [Talaromyces marneffei ATCC 18224]KAE8547696.1 hypothetical protein EYB25_009489 [Talaromyces marneffei]QGA21049.1 hypothetical protein EYB26_008759 [Talaromyces marneffei]